MNENKFTPTAEEALRLAQEAAGELGHGYVGTEHLLLGLMREDEGLAHDRVDGSGADRRPARQKWFVSQRRLRAARQQSGAGSDPQSQARGGDRHGGFHPGRLRLYRHGTPAGRHSPGGQQHGRPHPAVCRCGCPPAIHRFDEKAQRSAAGAGCRITAALPPGPRRRTARAARRWQSLPVI